MMAILFFLLGCAAAAGERDQAPGPGSAPTQAASDEKQPSPVELVGPQPVSSADCSRFANIPVPLPGGTPQSRCDPGAMAVSFLHPATGSTAPRREISAALMQEYGRVAASHGWIPADTTPGNAEWRHPDYAGWVVRIVGMVEDDGSRELNIASYPDRRKP